ncbi:glycerate kinase [Paenibacillus mendelii]|uniref:Glycerate kinase n=1 Tax=Paenibacillus mendelii TaxID=206163 RepID=A0ABV6JAT3_9BACL|nr:glycerate kinase [Paenibacillus mendelii]MCQ6561357.1 glycerate kinase [Paenibacillus mendelii]
MKIVIAPDSFKGSISARKAALAIQEGILRVGPDIETVIVPMADGGEGTVESLVDATNGHLQEAVVKDPLGRDVNAVYGILGHDNTCVIEIASASGLPLLKKEERNPMLTTSYGTGQLILHALDKGCRKFVIGLGGSGTNDGGAGMLQALGIRLLDSAGDDLSFGGGNLNLLADIELNGMDPRVREAEFIIACDVDNPLIGLNGASAVYGPQKGATPEMVELLDSNLAHYANRIEMKTNISIHHNLGAGSAGGLGGAFQAFFNARMERGIDIIMKQTGLKQKLDGASLVITGEGQIDFQTARGKTPAGVAQLAKSLGIPTFAIVGGIGSGIDQLRTIGIEAVFSIVNKPMDIEEAMKNSYDLLSSTAEQVMRVYISSLTQLSQKPDFFRDCIL